MSREKRAKMIASVLCVERAMELLRVQHAAVHGRGGVHRSGTEFVKGASSRSVLFATPCQGELVAAERLDCQIRQTAMHEAVSVLIGICDSFGPGVKSQVAHQCLYAVKTLLADEQRHAHSIGGNIVGHDHSKDEAKG